MSRTVVTKEDIERQVKLVREQAIRTAEAGAVASSPTITAEKPDDYRDRLIKYIPADVNIANASGLRHSGDSPTSME